MKEEQQTITDVFFDLDHTLWDFEKNSALAFEVVLKAQDIKVNIQDFLEFYKPINFEYWKLYREEQISAEQLRYGRLRDTFNLLNYTVSDEVISILSKEYLEYLPQFNHLFNGAIEILEYLKSKYRLHIITNGFHQAQNAKIQNSDIGSYFQTITNSELAGVKKPNPIIFQYALNTANANAVNSIMIGDCIDSDVNGALNCGIDAIYFNEEHKEVPANIKQVSHLLDLKNYL